MDINDSSDMPISTSPVYAYINDYVTPSIDNELKKFMPSFGNQDKYRLLSMIGRGKYSLVFSAVAVKPQSQNTQFERQSVKNNNKDPVIDKKKKLYAIKILKDVAFTRIKRELYILKRVSAAEPFPMTINFPQSQSFNMENEYNTLTSNIKPSSIEDFSKYESYSRIPLTTQPSSFSVPKNSLADINVFDFSFTNTCNYDNLKRSTSTSDNFSSSNYDIRNNNFSEQKNISNSISDTKNEEEKYTESIVRLYDVIRDELTGTISIVTDYNESNPPKHLYPTLTLDDVRYYMYRLLTALDVCHSRGVMHRDIKPGNVLISKSFNNDDEDSDDTHQTNQSYGNQTDDHIKRNLTIIDWGLAELYYPMKRYSTRVATMRYKAPELLLGYPFYDYGVDIWGAGCMMLEMLFEFRFIKGTTNQQVLYSISKLWGQNKIEKYVSRYKLENSETFVKYQEILSKKKNCDIFDSWAETVALRMRPSVRDRDALDLLKKLLEVDHGERITARDALRHRFFLPLFKSNPKETSDKMKMNLDMQMKQIQTINWSQAQKLKKRALF